MGVRCVLAAVTGSALGLSGAAALAAPSLSSLEPASGTGGVLVVVHGSELGLARVVWDAGLPTQRKLAAAIQGAVMFTAPAGAAVGAHPVRLEAPSGASAALSFTILANPANPKPRIDDIMLTDAAFTLAGQVKATLYVQSGLGE